MKEINLKGMSEEETQQLVNELAIMMNLDHPQLHSLTDVVPVCFESILSMHSTFIRIVDDEAMKIRYFQKYVDSKYIMQCSQ